MKRESDTTFYETSVTSVQYTSPARQRSMTLTHRATLRECRENVEKQEIKVENNKKISKCHAYQK